MKTNKRFAGGCLALVAATMAVCAQAAYPNNMQVTVEMWNDAAQDLHMTYASWAPQATGLNKYLISAQSSGLGFVVTLDNPRNDAATFRYASAEGKVCEFKMAHKTNFSWFGLNPAPEKSAIAKPIGTAAAQCTASVTKGSNAMESYTVRFSMK